jgi:hypothetical protein
MQPATGVLKNVSRMPVYFSSGSNHFPPYLSISRACVLAFPAKTANLNRYWKKTLQLSLFNRQT